MRHLVLSVSLIALLAAAAAPPAVAQSRTGDDPVVGSDGVDRRNPRRIRRSDGRASNRPRMQAGGVGIGGGSSTLGQYIALEPLIGEFTFTGNSWPNRDSEPGTFTGSWSNTWALGGYYMESRFDIDGTPDYHVLGMTCFDATMNRFESHFYNSNSATRTFRRGNFDEDGRVLSMESHFSNRPDEEPNSRVVFEIIDDDRFIYTGWAMDADSVWYRSYEITATRVGAEPVVEETSAEEETADTDDDSAEADDVGTEPDASPDGE